MSRKWSDLEIELLRQAKTDAQDAAKLYVEYYLAYPRTWPTFKSVKTRSVAALYFQTLKTPSLHCTDAFLEDLERLKAEDQHKTEKAAKAAAVVAKPAPAAPAKPVQTSLELPPHGYISRGDALKQTGRSESWLDKRTMLQKVIGTTMTSYGSVYYKLEDVARAHQLTRKSPTKSPASATVPVAATPAAPAATAAPAAPPAVLAEGPGPAIVALRAMDNGNRLAVTIRGDAAGWLHPMGNGFFYVDPRTRRWGAPGLTLNSDQPYSTKQEAAQALSFWPRRCPGTEVDAVAPAAEPAAAPLPVSNAYVINILEMQRKGLISQEHAAKLLKRVAM